MTRSTLLFYIIFVLLLFGIEVSGSELIDISLKKGEFSQSGIIYKFEQTDHTVTIRNSENEIVFYNECENENETILNFGYSETLGSFYVFKSQFNYSPVNYKFWFETDNTRISIKNKSSGGFYTPILIENNDNIFVAYINENRTIMIYDLLHNKTEYEFKSKSSIMYLQIISKNDTSMINFKELNDSQYKKVEIPVNDLFKKNFDFENKKYRPFHSIRLSIKKITLENDLQYDKFIGFGDSITFGKINREDAPELGYVPRLLSLLQSQLYTNADVVNEGISGSKTSEGLERIEDVIKNHTGKYLLFHYGANDMADQRIPLDSTKENIKNMMEIVINYKMSPVLTTLIPGNGDKNGSGRYGGEIYVYRSEMISEGIREIAISKNIPLIDLQKIFKDYPESDGGYLSLMSDGLHPSEKGYQLMAEEWTDSLLGFPPLNISNVIFTPPSGLKASTQWINSPELDVNKYKIRFGFSSSNLNRETYTNLPSYTFIITPVTRLFYSKIYFKVNPVDTKDNVSIYSPIFVIDFNKDQSRVSSGSSKSSFEPKYK